MRTSRSSVVMPLPVRHALRKLGRDIRDARRRRRIPAAIAAQRASISRTTLVKIEKGDPGVAIGIYATVLFVLGMADRLGDLAASKNDPVGLQLEEENLPQRIRVARSYYERYVTLENTGHAPAGGACIRGRAAGTTGCNTQPF